MVEITERQAEHYSSLVEWVTGARMLLVAARDRLPPEEHELVASIDRLLDRDTVPSRSEEP